MTEERGREEDNICTFKMVNTHAARQMKFIPNV